MSNERDHTVIGKAVMEPEFRRRLLGDPEGTLKAERLTVSPDLMVRLKNANQTAAERLAEAVAAVFGQPPRDLSEAEMDMVVGGVDVIPVDPAFKTPTAAQLPIGTPTLPAGWNTATDFVGKK